MRNALESLGMKLYIDELEATNDKYGALYLIRLDEISKRYKGSTTPIQREVQHVLRILFDQIDFYQNAYKEIDYSPLISELNTLLTRYSKQIKIRETLNKKRADKLAEAKGTKAKSEKEELKTNSTNGTIKVTNQKEAEAKKLMMIIKRNRLTSKKQAKNKEQLSKVCLKL